MDNNITTNQLSTDLSKLLYDKSYSCPLCDKAFTAKTIKVNKNQVLSIDSDLHANYSLVNPLLYDIIVCPHCGYSAHVKSFDNLLSKQREWLKEHFSPLRPVPAYSEFTTLEEGIHKHKMALLASIIKKGKLGEQSYLALHIAWLYRDLGDMENEISFLQRAYDGLVETLSKERFPLFGIDEITIMYMLADIAYRLNKVDDAKRFLSIVLTSSGISPRVKDRALDLKNKIAQA